MHGIFSQYSFYDAAPAALRNEIVRSARGVSLACFGIRGPEQPGHQCLRGTGLRVALQDRSSLDDRLVVPFLAPEESRPFQVGLLREELQGVLRVLEHQSGGHADREHRRAP